MKVALHRRSAFRHLRTRENCAADGGVTLIASVLKLQQSWRRLAPEMRMANGLVDVYAALQQSWRRLAPEVQSGPAHAHPDM